MPALAPVIQKVAGPGPGITLVSSAEVTAEVVSLALGPEEANGSARITHYVTGGVPAYLHTAEAIGGVEGQVIPLDVVRLADAGLSVGPSSR